MLPSNGQDPPRKQKKVKVDKVVVDTTVRVERDTTLMKIRLQQMRLDTLLIEKKKK